MRLIFQTGLLVVLFIPSALFAQTKEIIAEGTYNMGDGETPSVAESRALLKAKQIAVEQAGTYVESYSKVKNITLTHDEIQVLASGLMEVEILDKKRTIVGDGINFWVKIKAKVNPDKMEEMAKRVKERTAVEDYKRIQDAYEQSRTEIELLKEQLLKARDDSEKKKAESKILEEERQYLSKSWYEKGFRHFNRGELDQAVEAFTSAIKLVPEDAVSYQDRGHVYVLRRQYDMAIVDYSKAIEIMLPMLELGVAFGNKRAVSFFKDMLAKSYNDRGVAYFRKGQYAKAIEDFDKAIATDPSLIIALVNRGSVYVKRGLTQKAVEDYNNACQMGHEVGCRKLNELIPAR